MPDWAVNELREALPAQWELHVSRSVVDGSGDGGSEPSPEVLGAVSGARVYVGFGVPASILEIGEGTLEWVHSGAAGVGGSLHETMLSSSVLFTNSAGIHGAPMAETVVGMLLHFARGLDFAIASAQLGEWDKTRFQSANTPVRELASMTIGILGYGGIGREVGRRVAGLGSKVLGLRRAPSRISDDPNGVEIVHGDLGLDRLLSESDALVIAVPDTPETRNLLTEKRIRTLRKGAVLINVARGHIVDEDALVTALRDGHLRGAGLDVFRDEPLPPQHPLWTLPNVLLTPHVSAVSRGFWRREMDLILDNFGRFLAGSPLVNQVNRTVGY